MSEAQTQDEFPEIQRGLEGEYEEEIEVVGDIHTTDVESYVEAVDQKYDEAPDAVLAVGDLGSAEGHDGIETSEDYGELVEENLSHLNQIGADVYFVPGNHDAVEGANPGQKMVEELGEDYLDEITEDLENVHNLEYDSAEIGDLTVVGGSHHFRPEIPEELRGETELEDFGYDLEQIADELEEDHKPDYGFWGEIPVIGNVIEYLGDIFDYGKEQVSPEDLEIEDIPDDILEEHGDYEKLQEYLELKDEFEQVKSDKKERLEQLLDDAGENVVVLDHGMPYCGEVDSDIDYMGEEAGHQGSLVWDELLQEYDIDSFFGGHFHGKGGQTDQVHGTEVHNIGPGQYLEAGYGEEGLDETFMYDQTMLGGEEYQRGPEEEQVDEQDGQIDQQEEEIGNIAGLIQEHGGVDDAVEEAVRPKVEKLVERGQISEERMEEVLDGEREKFQQVEQLMQSQRSD